MSWMMAAATLGAGALSSAGQLYANRQNLQFTKGANDTQIALANTAHQREVRDLIAAGLNPVLSAQGSGAPVPSLGSINSQNPGQGIADGINSATKYGSSQYRAQVKNLNAVTEKTNADTSAVKIHSDLVAQQRENEAIKADILRNERGSSVDKHFNTKLQEMALTEAITGRRRDGTGVIDWEDPGAVKAYNDLVQKYRNRIELERWLNSVERQMILDGVKSASDLKGIHIHSNKKGKRR